MENRNEKGQFKKGCPSGYKGKKRPELSGENHPLFGKHHTEEAKEKMRKARKKRTGSNSSNWKGDDVSYSGLHRWIRKKLGRASKCSNDSTHKAKRYEWANISGEYTRNLNDWRELCPSCHRKDGVRKAERFKERREPIRLSA